MNTKLLMASAALVMAFAGIALSFAPDDILKTIAITPNVIIRLMAQLLGALYLGFAMLNWMTKSMLMGGIFAKPISMANGLHFFIGAMALIKIGIRGAATPLLYTMCAIYSVYAAAFLYTAFTAPVATVKNEPINPRY